MHVYPAQICKLGGRSLILKLMLLSQVVVLFDFSIYVREVLPYEV